MGQTSHSVLSDRDLHCPQKLLVSVTARKELRYQVQRETTLTILVLTGEPVSMESEIVIEVSLSTTEISEITQLKKQS